MDDMPVPPWRERKMSTWAARRPLSYDQIVDAAIVVLDAEGVDGMSMRRVAQELGTGAASLYAHVQNKDDLVDAVLDRVFAEVVIPEPTGDWRHDFIQLAYATRSALQAHRDIAKVLWGKVPTGANALRLADHVYGVFRKMGLPDQLVGWAGPLVFDYITADAYDGSLYASTFGDEKGSAKYFEALGTYFASLPPERFPNIVVMAKTLTTGGGDERFEFGLDVLLTGLEAKARAFDTGSAGASVGSEALGDRGRDA
ncbi:TetR family transcriptional regulator ActII [Cryptosporangium japonicum]|uniref:TetR family transcriptional regulator ActII n=2 Tax=Cryptosporangium japonicum TaxID=80872 RepID=A0ABN0U5P8_9ACTN